MGGAIYLYNSPMSFVNESLFQDNEANDSGFSLFFYFSILCVDIFFLPFIFYLLLGGGIYIINDDPTTDIFLTTIENTNIYNNKCGSNSSQGDGAGIYLKNKNPVSVRVRNVTFVGNDIIEGEGGRGGGLMIEGNGSVLSQVSFSGNIAAFGGGLGLFFIYLFCSWFGLF